VDQERELHDQACTIYHVREIDRPQSLRSRQKNDNVREIHGEDDKEVEDTVSPYHGHQGSGDVVFKVFVGFICSQAGQQSKFQSQA
jgi:hypothetical protein